MFWKHDLPVKLTAMSAVVVAAPETEKKVSGGYSKGTQGTVNMHACTRN
jgi:hypothetical protein